jgi:hypothetical protein
MDVDIFLNEKPDDKDKHKDYSIKEKVQEVHMREDSQFVIYANSQELTRSIHC